MAKKNVCILSMQRVPNFGSVLQSYSLKKILEEQGCNVSFIDIEKKDEDYCLRDTYNNFEKESNGSKSLSATLKKIDKYFFNRVKLKFKSREQVSKFKEFADNELGLDEESNNKHYDYCVIGSDEVFNCMDNSWWGFTSQLFGNVRQADKVLTYAASCGATKLEQVPSKVKDKISQSLDTMVAISVRDQNTFDFVSNLSSIKLQINLDPVVVGNFDEEMRNASSINLPKHYCIVYAYANRIHDKEDIGKIKEFCKNNNLEIITVGGTQYWNKNHLVCEPFAMLNVFKNADMVITDTFHGTIFSAKYTKRFAVIIRDSNKNKLSDLVNRLDIKEHLINSLDELDKNYSIVKDQDKINKIIDKERTNTISYLKGNII